MSEEKTMPNKQENNEGSGHISRRDFLKDAGLAVGAPALGSIAVSSEAAAQAKAKAPAAKGTVSAAKPAAELTAVELTVNGGKYRYMVEPNWTLRQLLRDEIGFTSRSIPSSRHTSTTTRFNAGIAPRDSSAQPKRCWTKIRIRPKRMSGMPWVAIFAAAPLISGTLRLCWKPRQILSRRPDGFLGTI